MKDKKVAVLFDLDGVLVDTEGQYTRFWQRIGKRDFPSVPDFALRIKGNTLSSILSYWYPADEGRRREVQDELLAWEAEMDFPVIPGALSFLRSLRTDGIATAVVTSSNRAKMDCLYRSHPDFASNFDRIFTAEDALRSKPAPDCYISAATALGCDPSESYVFEDSISGLRAGRDAGATVIALTTTSDLATVAPLSDFQISDFTTFTVEQMLNLHTHLSK